MNFESKIFTGANVFLDGIGLIGVLKDFEPPKLEHEVVEVTGAIGKREKVLPTLKPLSTRFSLTDINPIILAGSSTILPKIWKLKANASSTGLVQTDSKVECLIGGNSKITELPKYEVNGEVVVSVEIAVHTFTYSIDNLPVIVYDFENSIYAVNGIDQYLTIRKNIM